MKAIDENDRHDTDSQAAQKWLVYDTNRHKGQAECDLSYICVDVIDETGLAECCELLLRYAYFRDIDLTRLPDLRVLDLSNSKIFELCTAGLENLESLDISNTKLINLDTTHLTSLKCLIAKTVLLRCIKATPLGNLEELKLSYEYLSYFLCIIGFEKLNRLKILETDAETLNSSGYTSFLTLEKLYICQGVFELQQFSFPQLRHLELAEHDDKTNVSGLDKLEYLKLNGECKFNGNISKLANLKHLHCHNADIDLAQYNLSRLESLSISGKQANAINVLELTNLRSLLVFGVMNTRIEFGAMPWLRELKLRNTGTKLVNITAMQQLEELEIDENSLTLEINAEMPKLRVLTLKTPGTDRLDTELLPGLRELIIGVTAVKQLDTTLLTQLEVLTINNSKLESLVLRDLSHLREIAVIHVQNDMANVELDNLPALKQLKIKNLKIAALSLRKLDQLRNIELYSLKADSIVCGELPALVRLKLQETVAKTASGCFEVDRIQPDEDGACNLMVVPGFAPSLQNIKTDSTDILNVQLTTCSFLHVVQFNDLCVLDVSTTANVRILEIDRTVRTEQLKWFGQLTNLRQLTCEWELETVPDFSKLQLLEKLDIVANKVQELDFSRLTALKWLEISCDRLEHLELGILPQLAYLSVQQFGGPNIAELDASGLQALQAFDCNANINDVKFGVHAALRFVQMKRVKNCSFDASGMPGLLKMCVHDFEGEKLADQLPNSLIYLEIYASCIKQLDLSNALKLQYLELINTDITELDVSKQRDLAVLLINAQMSMLTTGEHPHLRGLKLWSVQLCELNLAGMPALAQLELHEVGIGKIAASTLNSLVDLHIEYTSINNLDLNAMPNLRRLEMYKTNTTELDISAHQNLRYLKLDNTAIDSIDLSAARALEELEVGGTRIWFSNLYPCTSLLRLGIDKINEKTVDLKQLQNLVELDISGSEMTDLDISCLKKLTVFKAIKQLKRLKTGWHQYLTMLDLTSTQLTSFDISQMPNLEELDVAKSKITILHTATHLRMRELNVSNTAITRLDLRGMPNLIELYASGSCLRYCDISGIGSMHKLEFHNTNLRFVRLPRLHSVQLNSKMQFCDFRDVFDRNTRRWKFMVFGDHNGEEDNDILQLLDVFNDLY